MRTDLTLWASLKARSFVVGVVVMLVGTVVEEFALSRDQGGVVSSPLPIGLLAGILSGFVVGYLTKDAEVSVLRGFLGAYLGAITGAAVFAALYWGRMPEAGVFGWAVFFVGGLIIGLAVGWLSALAAAGSAYIAAFIARALADRHLRRSSVGDRRG